MDMIFSPIETRLSIGDSQSLEIKMASDVSEGPKDSSFRKVRVCEKLTE